MNRREFLRRASLIAAGIVAADQLEILERLTHRKVFAGWSPDRITATGILEQRRKYAAELAAMERYLRASYVYDIADLSPEYFKAHLESSHDGIRWTRATVKLVTA